MLERSIDEIDRAVAAAAGSADAATRVDGLVSAIQAEIAANEAGFRRLLQLSIAQSASVCLLVGVGSSEANDCLSCRPPKRIGRSFGSTVRVQLEEAVRFDLNPAPLGVA